MVKQAIEMINRNVLENVIDLKVSGKLQKFIDIEPKTFIYFIENLVDK